MRNILLGILLIVNVSAKYRLSEISISMGFVTLQVENGANLYVQSNDDESLLGKIKITNNLNTMTALELSKLGTNLDQTKTAWPVKGEVTISSTNTELDAAKLSGFVYFTTYTQAQDKSFLVYAVDKNLLISYDNSDLTVVFLNQNIDWDEQREKSRVIRPTYVPQKSSQVYDYTFVPGADISIYWDEPAETYKNSNSEESKQNRIFSNPIQLDEPQYFDTVEPFQIFNDIWYLRSSGQIRFQVKPKWDNPNGTTTSKVTTTGLVMCSFAPENVTVNMLHNYANSAISGMDVLYNVINPVKLSMSSFAFGINPANSAKNNRYAGRTASPSTLFQITSEYTDAGRFAAQYFQIEGAPLPTTTPGPSTTSQSTVSTATSATVITTTKGTSSMLNFMLIVAMIIGFKLTD